MFFSILIPTCNRPSTLGVCLKNLYDSLSNFKVDDYEVVVSDDSKADNSSELVKLRFPNALCVTGPQKGPAANRNNAAKFAKGKWLIFIDDDCIPNINFVQAYHTAILNYPNESVFEGAIVSERMPITPLEYAPINEHGGKLWSCNFCISSQVFKQLNGFDENFIFPHLEDVDLHKRIIQERYTIIFLKDTYVVHPWRTFKSGLQLALYNEMDFYFAKKYKQQVSIYKTVVSIIHVHFGMFIRTPRIKYVIPVIKVSLSHAFYFLIYSFKWKKKYIIYES